MGVEFVEIAGAEIPSTTDGTVFVSGSARAVAIAVGLSEVDGAVYVSGSAALDEEMVVVTPTLPNIVDGSVYASGDVTMADGIGSEVDGTVGVSGEAVLATVDADYLMAVDGTVYVDGDANSEFSFNGYYGFATELPEIVSCYVGMSFAQLSDSVGLQPDLDPLYIQVLREIAKLSQRRIGRYEGVAYADDLLLMRERLSFVIRMAMAEGVALDAVPAPAFTAVGRVINRLLLLGMVRHEAEATRLLADALTLLTVTDAFQTIGLDDSLVLSEFIEAVHTAVGRALEALLLAGAAGGSHQLTMLLRDTVVLDDAALTEVELVAALQDAIGFAMTLSFDDGTYTAWVLNTESAGLTTYSNFPFNSFAKIGRHYYGLHTGGIVRLGGDTDDGAPIAAKLRMGMFDFNDRNLKAFSEAYIGSSGGRLLLKAIWVDDATGNKMGALYRMKARPATASRETRFEMGKGIRAVDWDFELENVEGDAFDIQTIQFQPMVLSRRTRG